MAFIEWNNSYSVGITEIDNQHQKLFQLVNSFHSALSEGRGKEIIDKVLKDLASYTAFHFSKEEEIMKNFAYPDYSSHLKLHNNLISQVQEFSKSINEGKATSSIIEISPFLKKWLTNHIMVEDKKYQKYYIDSGKI